MKTINILIIVIIAISVLILAGCEKTDGQIELKEPKKELDEILPRKNWSITDAEGYGE
ncbi:MAG: hypothetical protein DHS20C09_20360 [marine bacterium B5-7]|nr:MAG: hypothetical protein DHS20C09_20360 [marine bacterium B5-7]